MKKILLAIMALMTFGGSFAEDTNDKFVVSKTTIPQGGSAVMTVQLSNPKNAYGGFQFDIQLPPGFKATAVAPAKRITDMGVDFSLSVSQPNKDKNEYNILGYNTEMTNIVGTEGDLVYVTISADAMVALGEYEATIINQTMSTVDAKEFTAPDMTVKLIVTDQWILDENSTAAPAASDGAVNILVKRTLKANQWSTICLPFDMTQDQVKEAFGSDVQIAFFDADAKNVVKVTGNPVESIEVEFKSYDFTSMGGMFYGCTPYLIKVSKEITEFETNAQIYVDEDYLTQEYSTTTRPKKTYGFYGKLQAGTVIPENGLFLSGNEFWYSTGKTVMKGFRGYFQFTDVVPRSSSAKVTFNVDGEATSIDGMNIKYAVEGVYDLSGRKIQLQDGDLNKLQKGVYIIDGKKVTIK
jgi:hypothetical protein